MTTNAGNVITRAKRYLSNKLIGAEVAAAYNPDKPYKNWSGKSSWLLSYNPDDLVKSKGRSVKIYQEMIREPFVKAALQQKKTSLLSVPWGIKPASQNPDHVTHARFVRWSLANLAGGFARDIWEMCDGVNIGYSILEKVPEIVTSGEWQGKITFHALKSKNPHYFGFDTDEFDNLTENGVIMTQAADGRINVPLPTEKFFIFSYNKLYENLYGQSDLRAAYRAYWIKDTAWKLRSIYMERFSGNALKGKYPRNKDAKENKEKLLDIFRSWQNETGVAIPEDLEIEVLNIATSSDSEYARAMSDCNQEIAIGILGETLTLNEGRKTGARNMGEIHAKVVDLLVLYLDMILSGDINEQLARELVDLNWANVDAYPEFYWYPREDYDPVQFGSAVKSWQEAGAEISKSWFYERTRMPLPSGPEDMLVPKPAPAPQFGQNLGQTEGQNLNREGAKVAKENQGSSPGNGQIPEQPQKMAEPASATPGLPTPNSSPYYRDLNKFEKFAEIPKIDRQTMALVEGAKTAAAPAYLKIKAAVLDQIQKKQVLENKDFTAAANIKVNTKPLQVVFQKTLLTADLMGRASAVENARNQGYDMKGMKKFAEDWQMIDAPVTPDEAVKYFSGKIPMTKEEYQALINAKYQESFYVAGLEKTQITKDVQALLTDALKNGWDYKKFKFELDRAFDNYAKANWEQQGATSEKLTDAHAETVFRTNIMDSFNQGRKTVLEDPDVQEYFPAWMLSCILDGRTRPWHADMDGATFLADDPIWDRITPPNGYNCREVIVPINKYDFTSDMLWDKSDIPGNYPDPDFKG